MDNTPSNAHPEEEPPQEPALIDPSWEKWRNEQVQTISNILSNVFKVEDEVRQIQAPSRLLRNPARKSGGSEEEICEKLNAIRQQISEYEQMLQMSLKRIDSALKVIQPHELEEKPEQTAPVVKTPRKLGSLKKWVKSNLSFKRKKARSN
jgi:small-conductance mechanosensitive channel